MIIPIRNRGISIRTVGVKKKLSLSIYFIDYQARKSGSKRQVVTIKDWLRVFHGCMQHSENNQLFTLCSINDDVWETGNNKFTCASFASPFSDGRIVSQLSERHRLSYLLWQPQPVDCPEQYTPSTWSRLPAAPSLPGVQLLIRYFNRKWQSVLHLHLLVKQGHRLGCRHSQRLEDAFDILLYLTLSPSVNAFLCARLFSRCFR